jgi:hypothetical protein
VVVVVKVPKGGSLGCYFVNVVASAAASSTISAEVDIP